MSSRAANALVFFTSAAVLVLEILAGRLMAPYLGVSLETFTGIIGTVLAGIAAGAWLGGLLADSREPARLIGPALAAGGALTWLTLPIIDALGPELGSGPMAIVMLTASAFFVPSAVLTAVSPMVTKLRLRSLEETGAVVGGLSAAGTIGALAGTFITGFILVSAVPTRPTIVGLGATLAVAGAITTWRLGRSRPPLVIVALVGLTGAAGLSAGGPCQHETGYYCVVVEADEARPSLRSLYLDGVRHAAVDLEDPTVLDVRYARVFAGFAGGLADGPLRTLHIGGGGFSFPRYLDHIRPGSTDVVLEIDGELVAVVEEELGLERRAGLDIRIGDARLAMDDLPTAGFDLAIGDAFASLSVPWHLTTKEFVAELERVLTPAGMYLMNVIDGPDADFPRAELATLAAHFDHVAVVVPAIERRAGSNYVLVASDAAIPEVVLDADDGRLLLGSEVDAFIDGAEPLRDDFAPVDQMIG